MTEVTEGIVTSRSTDVEGSTTLHASRGDADAQAISGRVTSWHGLSPASPRAEWRWDPRLRRHTALCTDMAVVSTVKALSLHRVTVNLGRSLPE
jgi:hypothetical protein